MVLPSSCWLCALLAMLCGAALSQLEAPPAPFETRPWPADGATLKANPPAFVWVPAEAADEYVLEYTQDPGFAADATTVVRTPWLIHAPQEALSAGPRCLLPERKQGRRPGRGRTVRGKRVS